MNEQPLNLRTALREIWRRRGLIAIVAVLCAMAGVAYGFLKPANNTSIALVLLPQSAKMGTAGSSISTDEVIARSTPVLAAAGAKLSPPLGALAVKKIVSVNQLSGQILQISAQGSTSDDAVRLANGVAASFIQYVSQLGTESSGPAVASLKHQSALLTQQINDLQTQINTVSNRLNQEGPESEAGQEDSTLLGELRGEQNQVSVQLNSTASRLAEAQLTNGSATAATMVVQKATVQPLSRYELPIEGGIIGFIIGWLGGAVFVLIKAQRGSRLRFRDEFARGAGAPVLASLEAPACATASSWRALLGGVHRPSDEWGLRLLLDAVHSGPGPRRAVRVISFADDLPALTTGPRLALQAAVNGIDTSLALGVQPEVMPLWAVCTGPEGVGDGLPLTVGASGASESPRQLTVSVVVLERTSPTLTASDAINVLSVSPNLLTNDELAQLALTATDHGSVLEGVVVVNPDRGDTTTGRWDGEVVRRSFRSANTEASVSVDPLTGHDSSGRLVTTGKKS